MESQPQNPEFRNKTLVMPTNYSQFQVSLDRLTINQRTYYNLLKGIQDFEADFLWKVSLKILNSGITLKTFTHDSVLWSEEALR